MKNCRKCVLMINNCAHTCVIPIGGSGGKKRNDKFLTIEQNLKFHSRSNSTLLSSSFFLSSDIMYDLCLSIFLKCHCYYTNSQWNEIFSNFPPPYTLPLTTYTCTYTQLEQFILHVKSFLE